MRLLFPFALSLFLSIFNNLSLNYPRFMINLQMFSPFLIAFHYFSFPAHQSLLCLSLSFPSVRALFPIPYFTIRTSLFKLSMSLIRPLSAYRPLAYLYLLFLFYFLFNSLLLPTQRALNVPFVICLSFSLLSFSYLLFSSFFSFPLSFNSYYHSSSYPHSYSLKQTQSLTR